jgi:nicotinate phosphoribosyltransferase
MVRIGTSISNAPVIDFAMDIVEIEGKPFAKGCKRSGSKRVLLCIKYEIRKIIPLTLVEMQTCSCGGVFYGYVEPRAR